MHKDRRREEDAVTALQYALRQMDDGKSARRLVRSDDIERLLNGESLSRLLPTGVLIRPLSSASDWEITDGDRRLAEEIRRSVSRDDASEEYVILSVMEEGEGRRHIETQPASAGDVMQTLKDTEIEDIIRKAGIPSVRDILKRREEDTRAEKKARQRGGNGREMML